MRCARAASTQPAPRLVQREWSCRCWIPPDSAALNWGIRVSRSRGVVAVRIVDEAIEGASGSARKLHAEVDVRWSDIDADESLDHAHLVTMLAEARNRWLFAIGAPTSALAYRCAVVDLQVAYRRRLCLGDGPLSVTMWTRHVRACDFVIDYEIRPRGAALDSPSAVTASTRLAAVVPNTDAPRRFSSNEREYLLRWAQ